jgi:hypothetical protein
MYIDKQVNSFFTLDIGMQIEIHRVVLSARLGCFLEAGRFWGH